MALTRSPGLNFVASSVAIADGSLRSTIAHDARQGTQGTFGAEVHDGALLVLCHDGHEHLCGDDGAEEVQLHDLAESVEVEVEEGLVGSNGSAGHVASGGIQQDIDGAEALHNIVAVLLQNLLLQDVRDEEECLALLVQLCFKLLALVFDAVEHDNLCPLLYQIVGNVPAQDAATASQHDNFPFDVE